MTSDTKERGLVSVIVPTRDRLALLQETLQSLSDQSCDDWEAVIVDDGSNDGTQEYMRQLCGSDPRFRYFQREGAATGACVCRNQGARKAKGNFLIFLDSDDLLAPECIERRLAFTRRNVDLDFCVYQGEAFGEGTGGSNRPFSEYTRAGDLDRFLFQDFPWEITSPIWRRSAFEQLGGFDERLPSWQDVELHIRAIISGMNYITLRHTDHFIRWQNDPKKISLQQRTDAAHLTAGSEMLRRIRQSLQEAGLLTWTRQRALGGWHFVIAERFARSRRYMQAFRSWFDVFRNGVIDSSTFIQGLLILMIQTPQWFHNWFGYRLVGRWKGRVRFREQPKLSSKTKPLTTPKEREHARTALPILRRT